MTEGKELHYGKMTLVVGSIIGFIIAGILIFLGVFVCFNFGEYYLILAAVIFIAGIIVGIYSASMLIGALIFNKTQELLGEKNYCTRCNREIDDNVICPYCGKKINKWYLKLKNNQAYNESKNNENNNEDN